MSNVATSIAGDAKTPVVSNVVTESQMLAARLKAYAPEPPKEEVKADPEAELEAESPEKPESVEVKKEAEVVPETSEATVKNQDADVLSKFDLDKMSEQERDALAKHLGSKSVSRFSELTADKKALQQQLAVLQQQLAQVQSQKPVIESKVEIPAEIAAIGDIDGLKTVVSRMDSTIEWADDVLDRAEHLGYEDVVAVEDGVSYTKGRVKQILKDARRAKDKYIPAQLTEIQTKAARAALKNQYLETAKKELEWVSGEDNDLRKEYEVLAASPVIKKIRESVPEVEPELDYILMHALNSAKGKRYYKMANHDTPAEKPGVKLTPPSLIKAQAAGRGEVEAKQIKELENKVKTKGSYDDFLALRIKQHSQAR